MKVAPNRVRQNSPGPDPESMRLDWRATVNGTRIASYPPAAGKGLSIAERFASKLVPGENGCIEWAASTSAGYGQFKVAGKMLKAHRVAWELANGPVPDGLMVCHTCDNRTCCNTAHHFLGTAKDNQQDMVRKGRKADHNSPKTHCPRDHPYDAENTRITSLGSRACRECDRQHQARRVAARRERREAGL